ncbi:MAG: hypothetical protein HKN97_05980 [Myxococcales bacterium]|nr:hypothetical protein [Myxococcales bacterium]
MKKFISASSALLATAMMVTLSFGCGEGIEGDTGSAELAQMQSNDGTCNSTVARSMGTAQKCFRSGACEFGTAECEEVLGVLGELLNDEYCGPAILNDELNGLPSGNPTDMPAGSSRPGELKQIGVVICSAISDCGACPALPPGFCPGIC